MESVLTRSKKRSAAPIEGAAVRAPVPTKKAIRILLAEDHPVVRKGITAFLSQQEDLMVIDEAANGQEALKKATELKPDVVLMDIDMPRMDGLTVTELLKKEVPQVKVVILSTHPGTRYAMRIIRSGARGYVLKDASADELAKAITAVAAGETFFGAEVARVALDQLVSKNGDQTGQLTAREREVLTHIAEGLFNKEIADRLHIGTRTVETHRERIMNKLNIHSTAGLVRFAIAHGLTTLPDVPEATPA